MVDTDLHDRLFLVTGANHGIGTATVIAFAGQGATVFLHYLRAEPRPALRGEQRIASPEM